MFDSRFFADTYDLYRPTVTTAATGEQSISEPATPTASAQPCHYVPHPSAWRPMPAGLDLEYDAVMFVPAAYVLRPAQRGQQPDVVEISGRRYVVMACWNAGGAGLYNRVPLKER